MTFNGDPETISRSFNLAVCPRRAYYVRKRRTANGAYLIHLSELFQIDGLGEVIWSLCDGETPVADMIGRVRQSFPQTEGIELLQYVASSLLFMARNNLLEPWWPLTLPPAIESATFDKPLAALMQEFHKDKSTPWDQPLTRAVSEKVQIRFFRICYESYWAAVSDKRHAMNELTFRNVWAEQVVLTKDTAVQAWANEFGLQRWYFKPQENRIVMSLGKSVYEGDVDHRL